MNKFKVSSLKYSTKKKLNNLASIFVIALMVVTVIALMWRHNQNEKNVAELCQKFPKGTSPKAFFSEGEALGAERFYCQSGNNADLMSIFKLSPFDLNEHMEFTVTPKLSACLNLQDADAAISMQGESAKSGVWHHYARITITEGKIVDCRASVAHL
jgi:hypothetical protein